MSAAPRRRPTTSLWAELRNSPIHGRGLYASQLIPQGTRIIEYLGERITKKESNLREAARQARAHSKGGDAGCVYIFELNKRYDLDGSMSWNTARLINHSCDANCDSANLRGHIWIVASRDIEAGEELSFDYGFGLENWREHPCLCGTKKCVGFIVTKLQRWRVKRILSKERRAARFGKPKA